MKKNKFRGLNNVYLTKPLFFEMSEGDKSRVLYTLKDEDHLGYPSIRRLFLEENDPTGYKFSQKHLGGWPHLQKLLDIQWFQDFWTLWQEELAAKLASEYLEQLNTKRGDPKILQYLLSNGYLKKESSVGRPTKKKITQEAEKMIRDKYEIEDDHLRMTEFIN